MLNLTLKVVAGLVGAVALAVLGHAALVHSSKSATGAASTARSTCATCHG